MRATLALNGLSNPEAELKKKMLLVEKKSHTCEEGGARLRISVWHILMNLKNNCLLRGFIPLIFSKKSFFAF